MSLEETALYSRRQEEAKQLAVFNVFLQSTIGRALSGLPGGAGDLLRQFLFRTNSLYEFRYPPERLTDINAERLRVASIANQVLDELLLKPYQAPLSENDYLRIRESIKNYYLLTAPCLDPNQYPMVVAAEENTKVNHIGRLGLNQKVWIANERSERANHLLSVEELGDFERKETERWFKKYEGLLDHVFVAAEPFMIELVFALQKKIAKNLLDGQQLNAFQQALLKVDPFLYGIKMLFHDDGRKISQHRVAHEWETQRVLALAGVDTHFREEPAHPVVGRELTSSVTKMDPTEENIMQLLFYFADCVAKVDKETKKLRRSREFDTIFKKQNDRYTSISSDNTHATFEEIIFGKILFWLQDHELGFDFSIEELEQVYQVVESGIDQKRSELGLVD